MLKDIELLSIWMSDASISNGTINSRIGTPLIHLCFILPILPLLMDEINTFLMVQSIPGIMNLFLNCFLLIQHVYVAIMY